MNKSTIYQNLYNITNEQINSNNWEENLNLLLKFQLAEYMVKMEQEKQHNKVADTYNGLFKDDYE